MKCNLLLRHIALRFRGVWCKKTNRSFYAVHVLRTNINSEAARACLHLGNRSVVFAATKYLLVPHLGNVLFALTPSPYSVRSSFSHISAPILFYPPCPLLVCLKTHCRLFSNNVCTICKLLLLTSIPIKYLHHRFRFILVKLA